MRGDNLASVCKSQSVFAPASPEVPTLVVKVKLWLPQRGAGAWPELAKEQPVGAQSPWSVAQGALCCLK